MRVRRSICHLIASRQLSSTQLNDPDAGATLLLALVFLLVVSLLSITLVQVAGDNLLQTVQFKSAQINQSATNSVTEVALYQTRFNFPAYLLLNTTPAPCWTTTSTLNSSTPTPTPSSIIFPVNSSVNVTASAWCVMSIDPSTAFDRAVTIYSCLAGTSATACMANPMTLAKAEFSDFPTNLTATNCVPGQGIQTLGAASTCGTTSKLLSWIDRSTLS